MHGVAGNASQLGGVDQSGYVHNGFYGQETLRFVSTDVSAGTSAEVYPSIPNGRLDVACSDPALSAHVQYSFEPGTLGHIERTHNGSTIFGITDPGFTSGSTTTPST